MPNGSSCLPGALQLFAAANFLSLLGLLQCQLLSRTDADANATPGKAFTAFVVDGDSPGITRGHKIVN